MNVNEVINSIPFKNFFELEENHDLSKNENLDKYKMMIEKNK